MHVSVITTFIVLCLKGIVVLISAFRILPSVPKVYTEWFPTVPSVTIGYKKR